MRRWVVLGCVVVWLLMPTHARAQFGDTRALTFGTAHTLEPGAFEIGVFSPLQYGAVDGVTVGTHPVLQLLLTPNVHVRVRLFGIAGLAVAFQAGYQQTFLRQGDTDFPGEVNASAVVTQSFFSSSSAAAGQTVGGRLCLSATVGYGWAFFPTDHRLRLGTAAHWLMSPADLLLLQVVGTYSGPSDTWERPSVLLMYARAWSTFRLGAGVAVGRFAFVAWEDVRLSVNGVGFYPVIDVWWRF